MGRTPQFALLAALAVPAGALSVRRGNESRADACSCLGWVDAYTNHGVSCEFLGEEYCKGFFRRVPDAVCVNDLPSEAPRQHCLVSGECRELNGGMPFGPVSMKVCTQGQERALADSPPPELFSLAKRLDLDIGLLVKMAYPVSRVASWEDAQGFWAKHRLEPRLLPEQLQAMQGIMDSGKPHVIDSGDGHPPFAVVVGPKAYEISLNYPWLQLTSMLKRSIFDTPGKLTSVACVAAC